MLKTVTRLLIVITSLSIFNTIEVKSATAKTLTQEEVQRQINIVRKQISPNKDHRCAKYDGLIKKMDLHVEIFSYIMWRESRCQPKAIGWNYKPGMSYKNCKTSHHTTYKKCKAVKSYDLGLLQINSTWVTVTHRICKKPWGDMTVLLQIECNLKVAKYLFFNANGFGNWGFKV